MEAIGYQIFSSKSRVSTYGTLRTIYDYQCLAPVASVGSLNRKDLSASEITQRVTSKVQSGSICLFHNAALHTPEALPSILDFFQSGGYKVVPISQIILTGDYYMDHTGKQCPAETS